MTLAFDPSNPPVYLGPLADYFNLEYFSYSEEGYRDGFTPDHFEYIGVFKVDSEPTMFWRVKGEKICATVSAHGESVCLGMDDLPADAAT